MGVRIAINGFGRIGRMVARAILENNNKNLELVAVNDIADAKSLAHLFKYDSIHGRFKGGDVAVNGDEIIIAGKAVKVFAGKDPSDIPWKEVKADVVVESTGIFTSKDNGVNKKGKEVKQEKREI